MPKIYARRKAAESEAVMAVSIISVKEKQGEYQGKAYHNCIIFGVLPEVTNPQVVAGCEVKEYKMKADAFNACLNRNIGMLNNPDIKTVSDVIGLHITPVFDEWGHMIDFTLAVPEKKK